MVVSGEAAASKHNWRRPFDPIHQCKETLGGSAGAYCTVDVAAGEGSTRQAVNPGEPFRFGEIAIVDQITVIEGDFPHRSEH